MKRMLNQKGLSLVELMISLAISSLVTLGLIQMFTANQETSALLRGQATLGESGRFAMEMMSRSLRRANYRGCNSKRPIEDTIDTVPYEFSLDNGIRGYEGQAGGTWSPSFSTDLLPRTTGSTDTNVYAPGGETLTGLDLDAIVAETDVITVWFASDTEFSVDAATQPLTTGAETILLDATQAEVLAEMGQYHVAFINDCAVENMVVITAINNVSGQAELTHIAGAGVGSTVNLTPIMGTGSGYKENTVVSPIISHIFYIGTSANTNEFGDPVLSLFRKESLSAPVELVEGIEDMQILYGVDTGGAALVPTTYVNASLVADYRDVIAVRVQLTANSVDDVGSSDADGVLRRTFTQTIRLRNRLKKE